MRKGNLFYDIGFNLPYEFMKFVHLMWKYIESALISETSTVNLVLGSCSISLFYTKWLLGFLFKTKLNIMETGTDVHIATIACLILQPINTCWVI